MGASRFCSPHSKSLSWDLGGEKDLNKVRPDLCVHGSKLGRRGWGMRASLQNWDSPKPN